MVALQQELREDGFEVSMVKLCRWFGVARRSVYYRSTKAPAKIHPALATPIKSLIEEEPSFGYRTVAGLLGMNKNTVQRIFQLQGWQVRKRAVGRRPHIGMPVPFLLRSDDGLLFTSRHYTRLVRSYGLRQEFITPHCPQRNGMVERVIRTLKEQCADRHRFESQQHAMHIIGDWIQFYNHRRPYQALGMKTPAEAYALAA
jgi:putative transposase